MDPRLQRESESAAERRSPLVDTTSRRTAPYNLTRLVEPPIRRKRRTGDSRA